MSACVQRLNLGLVKDKYIMPLLSLPSDLFVSAAQSESAIPSTRWGGRKAMLWRLLDAKSKAGDGNFEDVSVEVRVQGVGLPIFAKQLSEEDWACDGSPRTADGVHAVSPP